MDKVYDLIIMGGGPGGMTAAIYAKRAGMDVVMIEKGVPGGAVATTYEVANYPGFTTISGMDLSVKMFEQTQALGIETIFDEIKSTNLSEKIKTVTCFGCELKGKTVLIAMGAAARRLNLDNERQFVGRGISYCATCDGALFKDKTVAVVGGGNSALEDAIYLSNLAKKVYLIHRRDEFRGEEILAKQVRESEKIELVLNSVPVKLTGDTAVRALDVQNKVDGSIRTLELDGVFVAIGRGPDTEFIDKNVKLNEGGYVIGDEYMRTNLEGVYVAGDIRNTPLRQIVCACSDGAIAATKAFEYIRTNKL